MDPRYRTLDADYFGYFEAEKKWIAMRTEDQYRTPYEGRTLGLDEIPDSVDPEAITYLNIPVRTGDVRLPRYLADLRNLRWLSLHLHLAPALYEAALPPKLEFLGFVGDGRFEIPPRPEFRNLRAISGGRVEIRFDPDTLPNLRAINCKVDRKRSLLNFLANVRQLEALAYGPFRTGDFEVIGSLPLVWLAVGPGRRESIEGISRLRGLRGLRLQEMSGLSSLDPIRSLEMLEQLIILSCHSLPPLSCLGEVTSLRVVSVSDCGDVDWGAVREKLADQLELLEG